MSESGATYLTYFGVVARDTEGRFVARFPDFPECVIRRPMLDQILDNADKAVRSQLDMFVQLGKPLPRPTSLEELKNDPENRRSFLLQFKIEIPEQ